MAKPLRSQLNQIRGWVRQGRTDAWIAHQLEVSAAELREFRRRHELEADDEGSEEADLRDEIEAEVEAATREEELAVEEEAPEEDEPEEGAEPAAEEAGEGAEGAPRRRRRRRGRRGGGGGRPGAGLQGTFDHGDTDGFGLWLDPALQDDPVYSEHWAGKRRVEVTVEPDQIVIRRSE